MDDSQKKALDLLREINTIGAGRVAMALSEILKTKVGISFPTAEFVSLKELLRKFDQDVRFFIIEANLEGDVNGRLAFFLHPQDAQILGTSLLNQDCTSIEPTDPLFQSALRETVNIFAGSYTDVLSEMTNLNIFYDPPFLHLGSVDVYVEMIPEQFFNPNLAFSINTVLRVENISFKGALVLLFDCDSVKRLFEAFSQSELVVWMVKMKMLKESKQWETQPS